MPAAPPLSRPAYLLLVLAFCLTWSSAFPAAKIAIGVSPPSLFLGARFLVAGLLLTAWALVRGELRGRVPWLALLLLGVANQAGYQGLAWQGMRSTTAGLATIISSLNPILIAALAAPLLGEAMSWRKVAGLLLGLAGAAFVVRNRIGLGEDPAGIVWLVLALVSMIVGTLAFKLLAPAVSLTAAVGVQQLGAGAVLLAAGALTEDPSQVRPGWTAALVMLWFVAVISIGAMLLWFRLLRDGTASSASALHFLMPPLGVAMSWAALGERVSPLDLLGIVPVALGIWLATRPEPRAAARLTPSRRPAPSG
jgi:drug/metabolite transporter (DMT)-like permease